MIMKFYVPGVPVEKRIQARVMGATGARKFVQFYNPKARETESVKYLLTRTIYSRLAPGRRYEIYGGPCEIRCLFNMPIPKSYPKSKRALIMAGKLQHVKKPDTSNLVKFIEDCLVGVVIVDDRQVINITAAKRYSDAPGTVIIIETLGGVHNDL